MNPYYATGFLSALFFWVWPAFLFRNLEAHWLTVAFFSAVIFMGAGWAVSELHIRFIAPRDPPRGRRSSIGIACFTIVIAALLTRVIHHWYFAA
jgi:hypothetical protein